MVKGAVTRSAWKTEVHANSKDAVTRSDWKTEFHANSKGAVTRSDWKIEFHANPKPAKTRTHQIKTIRAGHPCKKSCTTKIFHKLVEIKIVLMVYCILCHIIYGPLVKRLRHRPFTAVTRVRVPYGSLFLFKFLTSYKSGPVV